MLALGLALAAVAASAPVASASVDAFGHVHGSDARALKRAFKAHHKAGYVVRGLHASVLFHFRYAGVYWIRRAGGANVDSGVAVFKRRGRHGWHALTHLSRRLAANMQPDGLRYSLALTGGGEFKQNDVTGADDPSTTTTSTTDINLTLGGGVGLTGEPVEIVRGQEQPGPSATPMLLGGSGTAQYTDAGNPSNDYSCTVSLGPPSDQTEIDVLWPHSRFAVYVNLGEPVETSSVPDCGAQVANPGSSDPWIDMTLTPSSSPPLGKPFSVPISIHHSNSYQSLSLDGSVQFKLIDVEVPT